jgi:hypothetical protein
MSKRKFDIDSDDHMSILVSSMTEAHVAVLKRLDELPADFGLLAPFLETIRQAYEAAVPRPEIPVKVRN